MWYQKKITACNPTKFFFQHYLGYQTQLQKALQTNVNITDIFVALPLPPMHRFFIKTPWWAPVLFSNYIWRMPATERAVYLTFDDGPHPTITPWVLQQLAQYNAQATFFCIGTNVLAHPNTYESIVAAGHSTGNHTHNHFNGWRTSTKNYLHDVEQAAAFIKNTTLFRPPYGKIRKAQATGISTAMGNEAKIIMWDVLAADWDAKTKTEECVKNVINNVRDGSVIVFHDSEKAEKNLVYALPRVLQYLTAKNFVLKKLPMQ